MCIFIYEKAFNEYKVSLRSNDYVDVSKVAAYFGGGGHIQRGGLHDAGTSEGCDQQPDGTY